MSYASPAISIREPWDGHQGCEACRGTGALSYRRELLPGERSTQGTAGACYCPRGVWLTQDRQPLPNGRKPVLWNHAPREVYQRAMARARNS